MCEQMGLLDWLEGVELTDTAGLVDRTGLDAHLAALGVDDTRAVRANETRLGLALERVHDLSGTQPRIQIAMQKMMMTAHLDLVQLGNTLRDTHDETNLILNGLDDRVALPLVWLRVARYGVVPEPDLHVDLGPLDSLELMNASDQPRRARA